MTILEIFAMFDTTKVEIKKECQLLMVSKTTSFKKGKGKKGYFMRQQISCCSSEKPRVEPKPETKCFCDKGNNHWSRITLDAW